MASLSARSTPIETIGAPKTNINYVERQAIRAVVLNTATKQVALIHVVKGDCRQNIPPGNLFHLGRCIAKYRLDYKLPGGGVEADEDHKTALQREILEEIGCKVAIEDMVLIGASEEYRNDLHQISFCYRASLTEDTGKIELTADEVEDGLTHEWVDVKKALQSMEKSQPTNELGRFIKQRDMFFVKTFLDTA